MGFPARGIVHGAVPGPFLARVMRQNASPHREDLMNTLSENLDRHYPDRVLTALKG